MHNDGNAIIGGNLKVGPFYFVGNDDTWLRLLDTDNSATYKDLAVGSLFAGGEVQYSSDRRLKKNIKTISGALDKVLQLRGVSWNWKDERRGYGLQNGLIAQEVEQIIPEIVSEGSDGCKSIAYTQLIGPMVEAIKELKSENDLVKNENSQLRQELLALKERQSAIENMLLALSTDLPKEKIVSLKTDKR